MIGNRLRSVRTLVPLALTATLGACAGHGARLPAASWSPATAVPSANTLTSVSCVAPRFCAAVGGGNATTYTGGAFAKAMTIDRAASATTGLAAVSCAASTFCVAVDGAGGSFVYRGTTWSSAGRVSSAGMTSISCPTTLFCAALDQGGSVFSFDGRRWSAAQRIAGASQPLQIACTSSSFCMAVDPAGSGTYTFDGRQWQSAGSPQTSMPEGGSEPNVPSAASCAATGFCAVLDNFGEAFTRRGGAWSAATHFDPGLLNGHAAVSCSSKRFCMAADGNGLATAWDGHRWSQARQIDTAASGLSDVSCASARFCVAVDSLGRAIFYK